MPTEWPPASRAPLLAASITPPSPPQTTVPPTLAIALPTLYAALRATSVHESASKPTTEI